MEGGQENGGCEVGQGRFEVGFQGTGQRVESVGSPHLRLKAFKLPFPVYVKLCIIL